jgi:hypothetical protein
MKGQKMAVTPDPDDIYDDDDTIGEDEAAKLLKEDKLPPDQQKAISQTPFLTEKQDDDRGAMTELEEEPEMSTEGEREARSGGIDGYDADNDQEIVDADERDGHDSGD